MNKLIALALSGVAVAALPTAADARSHHRHHDRYYSARYAYPRYSTVYRARYVAPVVRVRSYGYPSYYGAGYYGGYGGYGGYSGYGSYGGYGYGNPAYGYGYGYPGYGYNAGYSPAYYGGYGGYGYRCGNPAAGAALGGIAGAVIGSSVSDGHHRHRYDRYGYGGNRAAGTIAGAAIGAALGGAIASGNC